MNMYVKPGKGMKVRMELNPAQVMPCHGAAVTPSPFWFRRIQDGSVIKITKTEFEKAEKAARSQPAAK